MLVSVVVVGCGLVVHAGTRENKADRERLRRVRRKGPWGPTP
jgi:hypothetical protein